MGKLPTYELETDPRRVDLVVQLPAGPLILASFSSRAATTAVLEGIDATYITEDNRQHLLGQVDQLPYPAALAPGEQGDWATTTVSEVNQMLAKRLRTRPSLD